jgi:hypothetical protein
MRVIARNLWLFLVLGGKSGCRGANRLILIDGESEGVEERVGMSPWVKRRLVE